MGSVELRCSIPEQIAREISKKSKSALWLIGARPLSPARVPSTLTARMLTRVQLFGPGKSTIVQLLASSNCPQLVPATRQAGWQRYPPCAQWRAGTRGTIARQRVRGKPWSLYAIAAPTHVAASCGVRLPKKRLCRVPAGAKWLSCMQPVRSEAPSACRFAPSARNAASECLA